MYMALLSAAATIGPAAGFVPLGGAPTARRRPRTFSTIVAVASAAPPPTAPAVPRRAAAPDTPPMLSLPMPELAELLGGSGRAKTFWEALCRGEDPRAEASAPVLEALGLRDIIPSTVQLATGSEDGTTKMLIELRDGLAVEAVLIPQVHPSTSIDHLPPLLAPPPPPPPPLSPSPPPPPPITATAAQQPAEHHALRLEPGRLRPRVPVLCDGHDGSSAQPER